MRPGNPRPNRSRGFTLVELLIVVLFIGVLAALAAPNLRRAIVKARAAAVVGDLYAIRVGVFNHHADHGTFPRDRNRGQIPSELVPYLPGGFSFRDEAYTLDYDNWAGRRGRRWRSTFDIGVTVIIPDRELGDEVLRMLGNNTWTNGSDKFTWVMEGQGVT